MRISRNCAGMKLYRNRHWINASHRFSRDCSNADCVSQNRDNFAQYSVAPLSLYDEVLLQSTVITFRRAAATRSSSQCYLCDVSLSPTVGGQYFITSTQARCIQTSVCWRFLRLLFCVISMQTSNNVVTASVGSHAHFTHFCVAAYVVTVAAWRNEKKMRARACNRRTQNFSRKIIQVIKKKTKKIFYVRLYVCVYCSCFFLINYWIKRYESFFLHLYIKIALQNLLTLH